jgi:hypothetical protein
MNMESVFHREERNFTEKYPNIPIATINGAKHYLELAAGGKIKSVNMDKETAEAAMIEFREGRMPNYAIEAHADDYLDYINGIERS